jgi:phytoene dehydrogenase-like protein
VTPTEAVVVGSGPNGMAAALTLAASGLSVTLLEGRETLGGGCRTEELTLPGFRHDVCAAVHPLLAMSPFFEQTGLHPRLVKLLTPQVAFAHPLDGSRAVAVLRSVDGTAAGLPSVDSARYRRLFSRLCADIDPIVRTFLAPLRSPPSHPIAVGRFALAGLVSARAVARRFQSEEARAVIAGAAAHAMLPLNSSLTGSYGLLFTAMAHASGWPLVEGGSARIVDAMASRLEDLGGRIVTSSWVRSLEEVSDARPLLMDISPKSLAAIARDRLTPRARRALERFRYGPGVCKVDWALDGPVPWTAAECSLAGTVHLGGTFEEIAASESDVAAGRHPERPFCLVAQPSIVDATRAPEGRHTLWAYCHVPAGSTVDMTERIENQIERFAPGFRDRVLARVTKTAAEVESYNPNYVGGDVNGGLATLRQTVFRPTVKWNPYRTALKGVYLCSSSTPPGGGVHGMCGYNAAKTALRDL